MGTLNIIRTVLPDVSEKAHNDEFLEEMGDIKVSLKPLGNKYNFFQNLKSLENPRTKFQMRMQMTVPQPIM